MIRLDRLGVTVLADWEQRVTKKLKLFADYQAHAKSFEKLSVKERRERGGFTKYAPQVLARKNDRAYFPSVWGEAKEAISKISRYKCAYCEHLLAARRTGQVEHFKPKSIFPTLAYEWANYFLACGGCNGAKADKWPDRGGYLRPDGKSDPCAKLKFHEDGKVEAVRSALAKRTIEDFDLNRTWLVRARKRFIEAVLKRVGQLARVYQVNQQLALEMAREDLAEFRDAEHIYSAALTQCFLRAWEKSCPHSPLE